MIIDMKSPKLANVMKYVEHQGEKTLEKAVKDLVEEDVEEGRIRARLLRYE